MVAEVKRERQVTLERMKLVETEKLMTSNDLEGVALGYEKIAESVKHLELAKDSSSI